MPELNCNNLRVILAIARTGTLAAAARMLRVDETTVGRQLAAAEAAPAARLFHRVDGALRPHGRQRAGGAVDTALALQLPEPPSDQTAEAEAAARIQIGEAESEPNMLDVFARGVRLGAKLAMTAQSSAQGAVPRDICSPLDDVERILGAFRAALLANAPAFAADPQQLQTARNEWDAAVAAATERVYAALSSAGISGAVDGTHIDLDRFVHRHLH